jgi:capsid portal protein
LGAAELDDTKKNISLSIRKEKKREQTMASFNLPPLYLHTIKERQLYFPN